MVNELGAKKWAQIAQQLPGRIAKQCRERWHNHLDPNVRKDPWTEEETRILLDARKVYGNQWAKVAALLPGRSAHPSGWAGTEIGVPWSGLITQ